MTNNFLSVVKSVVEAYKPIRKINWVYEIVHVLVWFYAHVMLRMHVHKLAPLPPGPKLFVANHPNFTDPFLLHLQERMNVLVTGNAFSSRFISKLLHKVGEIPVYPGGDALQVAVQRLKAGTSIGIFPEGAISPIEGGQAKGRSGAARIALSTGVSVVPVGIHLNKKLLIPINFKANGLQLPSYIYLRGAYSITIGEPMRFKGDVEDRELVGKVTETIMACIAMMENESRIHARDKIGLLQGFWQFVNRFFSFKFNGVI